MSPRELLSLIDFRAFIFTRFLVTFGLQMQFVAMSWQVYALTKDPLSLGLIGLAEVIPAVGFSVLGGYFVDRVNRRNLLFRALLATSFVSIFLVVLGIERLGLSPSLHVGLIYLSVFILGTARAFIAPASFALFGELLTREHYVRGAAWSSTIWQIAAASGPAVGGLVYGVGGAFHVFAAAFLCIACGSFFIYSIRPKPDPVPNKTEPFLSSLTSGLRFVFRHQIVWGAMALDLFAVLFGGCVAVLPIFADMMQVGPTGLGLLRAAPAAGAFLTALFLTQRPPLRNTGKVLLMSVAGFGVCIISFALSRNFYISMLILSISGALDAVSVVIRGSILQLATPQDMRGRVSSVSTIFISSSNELGSFESGLAAKILGLVPSVIFGGLMTLGVVGVMSTKAPKLRDLHLEDLNVDKKS